MLGELFKLAWPMLLANLALIGNGVIDTILLGNYGSVDLAAMSIAMALYSTVYAGCLAILQGVQQRMAQAQGAGDSSRLFLAVSQGVCLSFCCAVFAALSLAFLSVKLTWFDVPDGTAPLCAAYIRILCSALPFQLVLRVFYMLAQITGKAQRVMWFNVAGLGCKALLSSILIFGMVGINPQGATGAALASLLVTSIIGWLFLVTFPYVHKCTPRSIFSASLRPNPLELRAMLAIGIPAGLTGFIDVVSYTAVAILVTHMGVNASAAHQIIANLGSFFYFIPASLAAACSILVSKEIGRNQKERALLLSIFGIRCNTILALCAASLLWILREPLAIIYTDDPSVRVIVMGLFWILILYHFFDAQLVMLLSLLRCFNISFLPMVTYICLLLAVGLGGGWLLANHGWNYLFHVKPMGVGGFWIMATIGESCAFVLLVAIFGWISYRLQSDVIPIGESS